MCSIDSSLCCGDATTQAASDDAPSQRQGWRGLLSFSFEVRSCQGRVTLSYKSLRGVRALNTISPLRSVCPEYSMSIIQSFHLFRALHSRVKNHRRLLVHRWKTFLMSLDLSRSRHHWVLSMKPFYLFLCVVPTFGWFPSICVLWAAFPFDKIPKLFHRFLPSSNLSRIGNDLTLDDPFYLRL